MRSTAKAGLHVIRRNRNVIDKDECDTTEGYWHCLNDHRSYRLLPVSANDSPARHRTAGISDFCVHDRGRMHIYKKQSAVFLHGACNRLHLFSRYIFCGKKPVSIHIHHIFLRDALDLCAGRSGKSCRNSKKHPLGCRRGDAHILVFCRFPASDDSGLNGLRVSRRHNARPRMAGTQQSGEVVRTYRRIVFALSGAWRGSVLFSGGCSLVILLQWKARKSQLEVGVLRVLSASYCRTVRYCTDCSMGKLI